MRRDDDTIPIPKVGSLVFAVRDHLIFRSRRRNKFLIRASASTQDLEI